MLKKAIDKVFNPGYNTHTGLEVSNRDEYTFDKAITDRVFDNINTLDTALKEVTANTDVDYLIAGGAVRDGLLGLEPKDYDIFLDLSKTSEMEDEERDDLIALLNYNFHDKVRLPLFRHNFEQPWPVHNEAYKAMENTFFVYEHVFQGQEEGEDHRMIRERDDTYQLIYRKNNPDIATDPLGFVVNNFDWSLTKAYYKDGKVFVGQQFVDTMKTKGIKETDYETSHRIRSWFNRNMGVIGTTFKVNLNEVVPPHRPIAALNPADELPPLQGQIQLNAAHQAELDRQFWNAVQWRVAQNNENQAEVAPAVPEV